MSDTAALYSAFSGIRSSAVFTRRPDPIPGDLRIGWRLASTVLILKRCRADTANLEQIHVLTWALRSTQGRKVIGEWFSEQRRPNGLVIRYDPSTARTVNLAIAANLANRNANSTVSLTDSGRRLATLVWGNRDVLVEEKAFLEELPSRITQKAIHDLLDWGL